MSDTVSRAELERVWTKLDKESVRADKAVANLAAGLALAPALADLEGYIERRAAELAKPLIDEVRHQASKRVREADKETERQADLVLELRRQIKPLNQMVERAEAAGFIRFKDTKPEIIWQYGHVDHQEPDGIMPIIGEPRGKTPSLRRRPLHPAGPWEAVPEGEG